MNSSVTAPAKSSRKPPSIWVTQVVLGLFALFFGVSFFLASLRDLMAGQVVALLIRPALGFALTSSVVWVIWALQKRTRHARIAAGVTLLLLWMVMILGAIFSNHPRPEYLEYRNEAERRGGMAAQGLIHLGMAFLLYRIWFGRRVRHFLDSGREAAGTQ